MAIADTVKDIKPSQWALIAGAGLGLGLLLRMRSKAKAGTTATTTATDTPSTLNDTQGYGNYSGTGMTGWAGGAIIDPNAQSPQGNTPVPVAPVAPPPTGPPLLDYATARAWNLYHEGGGDPRPAGPEPSPQMLSQSLAAGTAQRLVTQASQKTLSNEGG